MTKDEFIDKLIEISKKKETLLLDIKILSDRQEKAVADEQLEILQKLIGKKQKRIEIINKLDDEFENYFEKFKEKYKFGDIQDLIKSNSVELKKLKEVITSIVGITKDIQDKDNKNRHKANELLKFFEVELKTANAGKKINNAYNAYSNKATAYFIDKKNKDGIFGNRLPKVLSLFLLNCLKHSFSCK